MKVSLQRIYRAVERAAYSDEPVEERRALYRRSVVAITEDLSRDELVELVHDVGALLESRFK